MNGRKLYSTACERNKGPIGDVLEGLLPERGLLLEIASGTGMHAAYLARRFGGLALQPTDLMPEHLRSVRAWCEGIVNVREPRVLDVTAPWPFEAADAILCCNMIHISPWPDTTVGLLEGAAKVLPEGGRLFLYGPFLSEDPPTAPSNLAFDRSLRMRDPRWGIRELSVVTRMAEERGLGLERVVPMPANNLTLVFRRGSSAQGSSGA